MARDCAANSGWDRRLELEGFQSDANSAWIASWHANVLLIKLGVPLSARKELPDNLGPQDEDPKSRRTFGEDSKMVDLAGAPSLLSCASVRPASVRPSGVRPSVRPSRKNRTPRS